MFDLINKRYDPIHCNEVLQLAHDGLLPSEWCRHFNISRETLKKRMQAHPDFNEACAVAIEYAQSAFEHKMRTELIHEPSSAHDSKLLAELLKANFADYKPSSKSEIKLEGGMSEEMRGKLDTLLADREAREALLEDDDI